MKKLKLKFIEYIYKKTLSYLKIHNRYELISTHEDDLNSTIALYSGATLGEGGLNHIEPWLDVLDSYGLDFVVLTRYMDVWDLIKYRNPKVKVVFIGGSMNADEFFIKYKKINIFLYTVNSPNNSLFLRYENIKHIFIGHGDSDKAASANRNFKVFDEIYVAGEAHIDRFRNSSFNIDGMVFKKIGKPNLKEAYLKRKNSEEGRKGLYSPTWEGYSIYQNYSSIKHSIDILNELIHNNLCIGFKPHPSTGQFNIKYKKFLDDVFNIFERKENFHFYDKNHVFKNLIEKYDFFICDISATVTDCLIMGKPIFLYYPNEFIFKSSNLALSEYTYIYKSKDELSLLINEVILNGNDYLKQNREIALNYLVDVKAMLRDEFQMELKR